MGRIPEETVALVLEAADIVSVIGNYFPLKRAGSAFKAVCPFHSEKTPSFTVDPGRQSYKCFGCGEYGNAVGFVMAYENLPFPDAVKKLATQFGVRIVEEASDPEADRKRRKIARIKELNNFAAQLFHRFLMRSPDAEHARAYLKDRGLSAETAKHWQIGWAPRNSAAFLMKLKEKGFNGREFKNAGLGNLRDRDNPRSGLYSKFYDQLMFPIANDYGDIVGFSGRILRPDDKRAKYINTPETPVFTKSKILFGLNHARKSMGRKKFGLICEGQIDAIALHHHGFDQAIAPLGTAFTEQHARLLKRYTEDIVLCYDGDAAGFKAAEKAFVQLAGAGLTVRLLPLPAGEDPDSYLQKLGPEAFQEQLENAGDFFDAKLGLELATLPKGSASARADLSQRMSNLASHIENAVLRDTTIQSIATRLQVSPATLRQAAATERKNNARFQKQDDPHKKAAPSVLPTPLEGTVAYLCHLAMQSDLALELLTEMLEDLDEPLSETSGGNLLRLVLAKRPAATTSAALQAFLQSLPESDRLALHQSELSELPTDVKRAVEENITLLLATHHQRQETALRQRLSDPELSSVQLLEVMAAIKAQQEILSSLEGRHIR